MKKIAAGAAGVLAGLGFAFIQSTNTSSDDTCDQYKDSNATRIQEELSRQAEIGAESPMFSVTGKKNGIVGADYTCTYTPADFK